MPRRHPGFMTSVEEARLLDVRKITIVRIHYERNLESRRIMIERYGISNFVRDIGPIQVLVEKKGTLYRCRLPGDEDVVLLRVKNSTQEENGSYKEYWFRVPPNTRSVQEGLAWGYGKQEKEYDPDIET
jgi:hypothetical protein